MNSIAYSLLLGVVEGITEFLPISSTGHMRLVEHLVGEPLVGETFMKTFDIFIQIGAIVAVVVYFRAKILDLFGIRPAPVSDTAAMPTAPAEPRDTAKQRKHVLWMILLATLPLGVGYFAAKRSDAYFNDHPSTETWAIALALGLGGILMVIIELLPRKPRTRRMEEITTRQALITGCCQILAAVFPGTSRSAATILGSMVSGMDRPTAAEFSFFLAIPAMCGAAGLKLVKFLKDGHPDLHQILLLAIGTLVAFIVAYFVIAAFMGLIRKYNFVPFGIYRILLAIVVLVMMRG